MANLYKNKLYPSLDPANASTTHRYTSNKFSEILTIHGRFFKIHWNNFYTTEQKFFKLKILAIRMTSELILLGWQPQFHFINYIRRNINLHQHSHSVYYLFQTQRLLKDICKRPYLPMKRSLIKFQVSFP